MRLNRTDGGAQRLSLAKLHAWEQLRYGMFIHFGMSTFDGNELSKGDRSSSDYAPTELDVDQWVQVARDAGFRYAVLTTKHVSGHALWPTKQSDYHVGTSGNKTDVVAAFVNACEKHSIKPGFYYCSWDNHHTLGSLTPNFTPFNSAFTTKAYRDFQFAQVEELLTQYGSVLEMWIDIPGVLGHEGRREQYQQIVSLQPEAYIMMNHGIGDGSKFNYDYAWPADLMAIERFLPNSDRGYKPWHSIPQIDRAYTPGVGGADAPSMKEYYLPGEVCDPIGYDWFATEKDQPRSDIELLGMRLVCEGRGCNLLLNVPPSKRGVIEKPYIDALQRLRRNYEKVK